MVVGWLCCCRYFFFLCFCLFSVFLLLFLTVQGCFNDGEDGAVVAEERKHSGGAQVVRNDPSSPLCSDPPVSVLLFFPKVFLLCFVLLASVFLFLHSARSRFPLCHCPSLLLQNFAPFSLRLSSSIYKQEKKDPPCSVPSWCRGETGCLTCAG